MNKQGIMSVRTVALNEQKDALIILDQTALPTHETYLSLRTCDEIADAISKLKVRGAPAIGIAAAYGLYVCCLNQKISSYEQLIRTFYSVKETLGKTRPTAVNLMTALNRMSQVVTSYKGTNVAELMEFLLREAQSIYAEDVLACRKIGEYALTLLKPEMGLLTHCNAGHLAVSAYGTALAPIYLGNEKGYNFKVYADETRPLLQGARLTAYELQKAGVDVTLICDNMASLVMKKGLIQAIVVGCDRIAANGDVANKIGTSGLAILAHHYGIPFYVLGPVSTIDVDCATGDAIIIEERNPDEVTDMWYSHRMAPNGVKVFNPAFDVTSHNLISAIITEKGIHYPPYHFTFN